MQGYRTILFTLLMTVMGMLGHKLAPDMANRWLDVFFAAWGIGAILMRMVTTTPVGAAVNAEIAALTERVHFLISRGPSAGDITDLLTAIHDLFGKLEANPQMSGELGDRLRQIETLLTTIQTIAPAASTIVDTLSPDTPAPSATAAAVVAAPVPEADGTSASLTSASVPTQPVGSTAPVWPSAPAPTPSIVPAL